MGMDNRALMGALRDSFTVRYFGISRKVSSTSSSSDNNKQGLGGANNEEMLLILVADKAMQQAPGAMVKGR
jgi:hypothetical protein